MSRRSAFWFVLIAALFFVVSGLVALIVAAKMQIPTLLGNISWLTWGRINIFATVAKRKYEQMYVSLWYILASVLWTAFVYIVGNFDLRWASRRSRRHRAGEKAVRRSLVLENDCKGKSHFELEPLGTPSRWNTRFVRCGP